MWDPGRADGGPPAVGAGAWEEDRPYSTLLLPSTSPRDWELPAGSPKERQHALKDLITLNFYHNFVNNSETPGIFEYPLAIITNVITINTFLRNNDSNIDFTCGGVISDNSDSINLTFGFCYNIKQQTK